MKKFLFILLFLQACSFKPEAIVYHSTAYDARKAIETYEEHEVSVHYIVEANGNIITLIEEDEQAVHAGPSYWRGHKSLNKNSIGIEVLEPSLGQKPYTQAQIESVIQLSKDLIEEYNIKPTMIVGHSDIAPTRKPDPGLAFFWQELAANDIGIWYNLVDAKKVDETCACKMLANIGYDVSDYAAAQYAFARHYVPKLVADQTQMKDLLDNPYPKGFDATDNKQFMDKLKAVYYRYSQPQCYN